jgi:hypothetical protein
MPRKRAPEKQTAERPKRPELPRTEPIRSWSTLFGADKGAPAGTPPGVQTAVDSVQRGVQLGYRVIDEYVKQGASAASAFASPSRSQLPNAQDLPQMTERMMQYASDFTSLWFDAMGMMMAGMNNARQTNGAAAESARSSDPGMGPAGAEKVATAVPGVIVQIRCERPAEVLVTLENTVVCGAPVTVESLRERSGTGVLDGVSVEMPTDAQGMLKVRLSIPKLVAPGRYTGALLDVGTKNPRGRLTVTVTK